MSDYIEIFRYRTGGAEKMRTHVVSYAPGYGLISNQHTTNGDWYDALNFALTELDPAYALDANHVGWWTVDRAGVPAEILRAAKGWCAAPEEDRRARFSRIKTFIRGHLVREEVIKLFPGEEVGAAEDGWVAVGTDSRIYVRWWSEPTLYSVQLRNPPAGAGHKTLVAAAIAAYEREQVERAADVASKERALERARAGCAWVEYRLSYLNSLPGR